MLLPLLLIVTACGTSAQKSNAAAGPAISTASAEDSAQTRAARMKTDCENSGGIWRGGECYYK